MGILIKTDLQKRLLLSFNARLITLMQEKNENER